MAQVTIDQVNGALKEVKQVAANKPFFQINFTTDTPEFNALLGLVALEGFKDASSTDNAVDIIAGALKAALLSVPRVITDTHAIRMEEGSKEQASAEQHRYVIFSNMGVLALKPSSSAAVDAKLDGLKQNIKAIIVAYVDAAAKAAAAPAPTPVP